MDAPTVVENNHKTTAVSRLGKTKPVVVHENKNGAIKLTDTGLKFNNTLGSNILEEKERWFYEWADNYDVWNDYLYTPTKENEPGSSNAFKDDNSIFKLIKTKHNWKLKPRIVSEAPTSIKSNFYIGERQS